MDSLLMGPCCSNILMLLYEQCVWRASLQTKFNLFYNLAAVQVLSRQEDFRVAYGGKHASMMWSIIFSAAPAAAPVWTPDFAISCTMRQLDVSRLRNLFAGFHARQYRGYCFHENMQVLKIRQAVRFAA